MLQFKLVVEPHYTQTLNIYMDLFQAQPSTGCNSYKVIAENCDRCCDEFEAVGCSRKAAVDYASTTNSPQSRQIMRAWLSDCLENHIECKRSQLSESYRPTRLLYVGEETDKSVHLVISASPDGFQEEYATLSHRWGEVEHPKLGRNKLTKETEATLRSGIDVTELPDTFRHAVEATRSLGLRFLWIDSMCIFQDSKSDWRKESVKMGGITTIASSTLPQQFRKIVMGVSFATETFSWPKNLN